ncbi:MAG: hypothetical protein LQ347_004528 [Umbilicaria vellea]|nr:MAG: hypothetical protein LQ347_004528 [Umbilicaria vellea]
MPAIPITIITGFLGSGKTTLILKLIPQLPKGYKLALLKNEFGDLAVDSQLASSSAISGVQELLNGCICCNLVGQLGDALDTLRKDVAPDRIIIETSGSAFPATLAMEVNRIGRETGNYVLDGVIVVIDVENWQGYEDTSYTAKLQARYTDLIVFNKWETVSERRYEDCLDRVGDLELQVANVKSDRGRVELEVLVGFDSALTKGMGFTEIKNSLEKDHAHNHETNHQNEVEVLSVTLTLDSGVQHGIDLDMLETFLLSAPKDEVYRIKAIITACDPPLSSDGKPAASADHHGGRTAKYILNWAFGRWTFTPLTTVGQGAGATSFSDSAAALLNGSGQEPLLRMTIITARQEAEKWKKRMLSGGLLEPEPQDPSRKLQVERMS